MPNAIKTGRSLEDLLPEGSIKSAGRDLNIREAWNNYVEGYMSKGEQPPMTYQQFKKIYETTGETP